MGLPRYLEDYKKRLIENDGSVDRWDYIALGVHLNSVSHRINYKYRDSTEKMFNHGINLALKKMFITSSYEKECTKSILLFELEMQRARELTIKGYNEERNKRKQINSNGKVKIKWFTHWGRKNNGIWHWYYKPLEIPEHMERFAVRYIDSKKNKEFELIKKKEELYKIRKIEQGRFFKGRLRQMILERDNYKCVLCGRSAKDNIILQVDHIKEWEDGGKTIYDNGQTLCNECNLGKHHLKKVNKKKYEFIELLSS